MSMDTTCTPVPTVSNAAERGQTAGARRCRGGRVQQFAAEQSIGEVRDHDDRDETCDAAGDLDRDIL